MSQLETNPSRLFALSEYEHAELNVFRLAVKCLMQAKDPLYAQIPERAPSETMPTIQNTMRSGETVRSEAVLLENKIVFRWNEIRNCNIDEFAEQADRTAEERLAVVMPHLFARVAQLSEAAGTAIDMKGAALTFESLLAAFSKIELWFDANGEPILPQLVVHPETAQVFSRLPPWTAEEQQKWNAMIDGKRKEYFANRRHRKLS